MGFSCSAELADVQRYNFTSGARRAWSFVLIGVFIADLTPQLASKQAPELDSKHTLQSG